MRRALVLLLGATLLAGCGSSTPSSTPSSGGPSRSGPGPAGSSGAPAGGLAAFDDYDGDRTPDPTCGTQDFGAGLVLRIPCTISNQHEPEDGTRLVANSLYRLPGPDV